MTNDGLKSVEGYRLKDRFQAVREVLLDAGNTDWLDKPLSFWALPSDRRLPLALLDQPVVRLLETPFDQLSATPGIGKKKMASLVTLLRRAAQSGGRCEVADRDEQDDKAPGRLGATGRSKKWRFDPDRVSESRWESWCEAVHRHGLGHLPLGRAAPSLQTLPTVIWRTPLEYYDGRSLAEIRKMKCYGRKRVRGVLEVFYRIHGLVGDLVESDSLSVRIAPKFVPPLESWIIAAVDRSRTLRIDDIKKHLVAPLMQQIETDAGSAIHGLLQSRITDKPNRPTVRQLADKLGVTRARVYQLLDHCAQILDVRWPEGRCFIDQLATAMNGPRADQKGLAMVYEVRSVLFPTRPVIR